MGECGVRRRRRRPLLNDDEEPNDCNDHRPVGWRRRDAEQHRPEAGPAEWMRLMMRRWGLWGIMPLIFSPWERLESTMKHVKLDAQEESVKRFVLALTVDPGGSVLEFNGKAVACVVPAPKPARGDSTSDEWTEQQNTRRCELIDKEIDGVLTPEEAVELRQLQDQMLRYQHKVAPWPIQAARQLYQELLKKAATAQDGPDA